MTSAIASTFICSICPLLPVSIVETPSIMMLFWPPPPRRVVVPVTPGVNCVRLAKLRPEIGRFSTEEVVIANDRSPLDAWMSGASEVTLTVSAAPPGSSVSAGMARRSPPLIATLVWRTVRNWSMVTSTV